MDLDTYGILQNGKRIATVTGTQNALVAFGALMNALCGAGESLTMVYKPEEN